MDGHSLASAIDTPKFLSRVCWLLTSRDWKASICQSYSVLAFSSGVIFSTIRAKKASVTILSPLRLLMAVVGTGTLWIAHLQVLIFLSPLGSGLLKRMLVLGASLVGFIVAHICGLALNHAISRIGHRPYLVEIRSPSAPEFQREGPWPCDVAFVQKVYNSFYFFGALIPYWIAYMFHGWPQAVILTIWLILFSALFLIYSRNLGPAVLLGYAALAQWAMPP